MWRAIRPTTATEAAAVADAALIEASGPAVWRTVVRLLGVKSDEAADCFQQTFVEYTALVRRDRLPPRSPEALLKRIAVARAIDCVRRRIRERARSAGDSVDRLSGPDAPPAEAAQTAELLADLRVALAGLPAQQASAFVLTQIEDVSPADTAALLGVTVNHLHVLLHRARARLREQLNSHQTVREARNHHE
jgi:RNA polymerase sigma-70 factor (ECF subfamily)